jgi:3-oxoacid CoA-transferase B subunit
MRSFLSREQMAWRAAQDLGDQTYVNLGIGLPSLVAAHVPPGRDVLFQSENGALGVCALPTPGEGHPDLIDAGARRVAMVAGGSFFDCATSFVMLRGGHIDLAVLGAFQVSRSGDLASWSIDSKDAPPAVGGAMDIAVGAKEVWVLMEHCTKRGERRLVEQCTLPVTARGVVRRVYTDLAVIDVVDGNFIVRESLPGMSFDALRDKTGAALVIDRAWKPLSFPTISRGEQ